MNDTNATELPLHRGSCHCGHLKYSVRMDATKASRCNCRICTKISPLGSIVKPSQFTFEGDYVLRMIDIEAHDQLGEAKKVLPEICLVGECSDEEEQVSYAELNRRANRLARYLRACGVGPDDRVAVSVARGVRLVECLLATLKAGAGYVPLDPGYPPERVAQMLEDSAPAVVLQGVGTEVPSETAGSARRVWVDRDRSAWSEACT